MPEQSDDNNNIGFNIDDINLAILSKQHAPDDYANAML